MADLCCAASRWRQLLTPVTLLELFRLHSSPRRGQAAALSQDGSINSPENPAPAGSIITLYANGAGLMDPPLQDGMVVMDTASKPVLPVSVRIGGAGAGILYAGPAPGLVAGVLQINVRVPQTYGCPPIPACYDHSATPVFLQIGPISAPELVLLRPTFEGAV